jgi:hypothetical protein
MEAEEAHGALLLWLLWTVGYTVLRAVVKEAGKMLCAVWWSLSCMFSG